MRNLRNAQFVILTLVAFIWCILPVLAFAGGNGTVGNDIVDMLTKLLQDNTLAMAIYTAIAGLIGIGLRVLLKKLPTVMQGVVGVVFWRIAAALFGDGVMLRNNTDPNFVKTELMKRYPLLRIDIKNPGK
jgi:hypothetical protein